MDERLKPGPEIDPEADPDTWKPSGRADGVYFLGGVSVTVQVPGSPNEQARKVIVESLERRALSYLRPASRAWCERHPGMLGIGKPNVAGWAPLELLKLAEERELPVEHLFTVDNRVALEAQRPEYRDRWRFHRVEEGIWAVLWAPESAGASSSGSAGLSSSS